MKEFFVSSEFLSFVFSISASRSLSPIVTFLIVASLTAKSKTVKILTEIGLIASLMTMVRSQSIVDYLNDYEYFDDDYYYEDYFEEPDHRPPNGHRPQHHNHHDPEPSKFKPKPLIEEL